MIQPVWGTPLCSHGGDFWGCVSSAPLDVKILRSQCLGACMTSSLTAHRSVVKIAGRVSTLAFVHPNTFKSV